MTLTRITNIRTNYDTWLRIIKQEETESILPGIIPFDPDIRYWFNVTDLKSILGVKHFTYIYPYINHKRKDARAFFQFVEHTNYISLADLIKILESDRFNHSIGGINWLLNDVIPNLDNFTYLGSKEYYQKRLKNEWPN